MLIVSILNGNCKIFLFVKKGFNDSFDPQSRDEQPANKGDKFPLSVEYIVVSV